MIEDHMSSKGLSLHSIEILKDILKDTKGARSHCKEVLLEQRKERKIVRKD